MSKNYFAIERDNQCWTNVILADSNGDPTFDEFLDMNYDEMKSSDKLSDFVTTVMDATNNEIGKNDDQTIITLVDEDNVFIWSIIMGPGKNDMIRYSLVDWKKDGKNYRYTP